MTCEHSRAVVAKLRESGVRAEHVDGTDLNSRRDRVFGDLRRGDIDVVGNCDLASEGLDIPGCDCVILGKPTRSLTRYLQMCGRAMRPGPGKIARILDLEGISHDPDMACPTIPASGHSRMGRSGIRRSGRGLKVRPLPELSPGIA